MKVKELIKQLKKCNPDAEVGYAHMDNSQDEVAVGIRVV
ncbi:hypothetical protein Psp6_00033 [Pseudomonas phage Psp6]|nr:hypothetical protein Psp6_00033 [Pseudomonas phage Psp6]